MNVSTNVTRLKEDYISIDSKVDVSEFHLKCIGRLIEQNETEIRNELNGIFINKSKQVINNARTTQKVDEAAKNEFRGELYEGVSKIAKMYM